MLNVLLESRAPHTRRMGSTVASALLHGALVAGAVALTMPGPVDAKVREEVTRPPIFIVPPPAPTSAPHRSASGGELVPPRGPVLTHIAVPEFVPKELPPIEAGPVTPSEEILIGGRSLSTASPIGAGDPSLRTGGAGLAIDERFVERVPRLLGRAVEPRYPTALRDAGVQGRVVVQFVVDTLGRAELDELQVVESPHAAFVESVRAALARYRFSVGEAGGRKVRTRVQIPFDFTLTK